MGSIPDNHSMDQFESTQEPVVVVLCSWHDFALFMGTELSNLFATRLGDYPQSAFQPILLTRRLLSRIESSINIVCHFVGSERVSSREKSINSKERSIRRSRILTLSLFQVGRKMV